MRLGLDGECGSAQLNDELYATGLLGYLERLRGCGGRGRRGWGWLWESAS